MQSPALARLQLEEWLDGLNLAPGAKLPTLRQIERKFKWTHHTAHRLMSELAAERDYTVVHGSGFFLPGAARSWRPFEKTIALVAPGTLLDNDTVAMLHREAIRRGFHFLNLGVSHADPELERETLEFLLHRRVWGVLCNPYPDPEARNIAILRRMRKQGTQCVLLSLPEGGREELNYALLDYRKAGYLAAVHALREGFGRVVFCNYSSGAWHTVNFRNGLQEGCADCELELVTAAPEADAAAFGRSLFVCETWHGRADRLFHALPPDCALAGYQETPVEGAPYPVFCFDDRRRLLDTLIRVSECRKGAIAEVYPPFLQKNL